ncbi:MAG: hypothetical protein QM541_02400 [Flavobacterium sp.]|nr:hypothetical protein [Flavobacterium sp.]
MRLINIKVVKVIFTLVFFLFLAACATIKESKIIKKYSTIMIERDSLINSLNKEYDMAIMYNKTSSWHPWATNYRILAFKKNKWVKILYNIKSARTIYEPPFDYTILNINKASADTIWQRFVKEEIWAIKSNDDGDCPLINGKPNFNCGISDAETFYLSIITKDGTVKKEYYAPFYWEECCAGNEDRQKFIRCFNSLKSIF